MGQLAHAFLFSGPRGVGKTTCARILAKSINCLTPSDDGEPCNECASCQSFNDGRSLNIHELDAASNNSVEDIRKIIDQVRYVPTTGKKSVFIIDEVHMLSSSAFNAFLKTLEEPPAHAIFIMATTEKHKILPTILSRVQKFDFRRIKVNDVADHLASICKKENVSFEYEALQLIGLKADGALRDGLSIFDQIVSYSHKNVTYPIVLENLHVLDYDYFFTAVDHILNQKHEALLLMLHEIIDLGFEVKDFMTGLTGHFRNLLVARTPETLNLLETSDNVKERYLKQCQEVSPSLLLNAFQLSSDTESSLKGVTNPRLQVELALMKLAYLKNAINLAKLASENPPEKKKSLAEPESQASAQPTDGQESEPVTSTGNELPPQKEDNPATVEEPKQNISLRPVKNTARPSSEAFVIPTDLDAIDINKVKEQQGIGEDDEEEEILTYDPTVNVDPEAMKKALRDLVTRLKRENKHSLASILSIPKFRLDHNKWIHVVANVMMKKQLELERWVIAEMREKLSISNLFLEVEIQDEGLPMADRMPYTNEEKLERMKEKNPNLSDFMKRFDAIVNYH